MSKHEKGFQQVANISNPEAVHASPVAFVSESRFAHFTRRASPAERQSLMVRAMRAATQAQRKVVEAYEQKEKTKRADQV